MKIPTRQRSRGLKFNITPLIDIVFLLIIFFLAASHFVRSESAEAVELPAATQKEDRDESPKRLVITITADQQMHVAGHVVELPGVERMISAGADEDADQFEVHIRGDRSVPYKLVEPIMLACARSGVTKFKFAVIVE